MNRIGIALLRYLIDVRSTGITQPDGARHLVKSLTRCIIPGPADDLIFSVILDHHQMRMSAGSHQTDKRRLQFLIFYKISTDMSLNVMNTYQRNTGSKADCFGFGYPHQKCSHQSRSVGHRNRRDIVKCHMGIGKCLLNDLVDLLDMLPGCDLRHHAAVQRM